MPNHHVGQFERCDPSIFINEDDFFIFGGFGSTIRRYLLCHPVGLLNLIGLRFRPVIKHHNCIAAASTNTASKTIMNMMNVTSSFWPSKG
jgi:hypothetical protein